MQLGILKALVPIDIATIQSQICAGRKEPVQCRPKSAQLALAYSCREPWRYIRSADRLSPLGPRGIVSLLRSRARGADYACCWSHPAVRRGRKEVKVEKPAAAYSDQGQR